MCSVSENIVAMLLVLRTLVSLLRIDCGLSYASQLLSHRERHERLCSGCRHLLPYRHEVVHWVFLQCMSHTWNISCDFHAVRETHASNLSDSRVWFLWSLSCNFCADTTLERWREKYGPILKSVETAHQGYRFWFALRAYSFSFYKLIYGWHVKNVKLKAKN